MTESVPSAEQSPPSKTLADMRLGALQSKAFPVVSFASPFATKMAVFIDDAESYVSLCVSAALKDASHWKHEAEEAHTVLDQYAAENTELRAALSAAVAQERERCAEIADDYEPLAASPGRIAEAIRKS